MPICGNCDQTILSGETYDAHDKDSSSAGGVTIHLHKQCPPTPSWIARRERHQSRAEPTPI